MQLLLLKKHRVFNKLVSENKSGTATFRVNAKPAVFKDSSFLEWPTMLDKIFETSII